MENPEKSVINVTSPIEWLEDRSEASVGRNPYFRWAKIVITDDKPNANNERVPEDEFANLIRTGIFTPVKMASKQLAGHKEALGKAIGTITQIIQENNKLIALAALWEQERPEDVKLLKDMYENGTPPNVSWEIAHSKTVDEDDGVKALKNTSLVGLVFVSNPAYTGRTPVIAFASDDNTEEDKFVEELEQAKERISELELELSTLKDSLAEKELALSELDDLRKFKQEIDKANAEKEQLINIISKFKEAGITKSEDYFETNRELLLDLNDAALDFMIQELIAFSDLSETKAEKNLELPNIVGTQNKRKSPADIGKALRESKLRK